MTREAPNQLTQQACAGVRRVPWRTVLAGAGGASVVALLAVSGVGPLVSAVTAGTLALPVVQGWLANLGANALSGWLAAWATSATSTALTVTELEQRAAELEQHTTADPTLAPALAALLAAIDAVPQSLDALAEEIGAQRDLLLSQYALLTRISADVTRMGLGHAVLGQVVAAQADRVIAALEARADRTDAKLDQALATLRALRDAQRQALISFAGAQTRDVTVGDVAGRDMHKPTLGPGSIYAPGGLYISTMQQIEVKDGGNVGSIIGSQVNYGVAPSPTGSSANATTAQRQRLAAHRATLAQYLHQLAITGSAHARPEIPYGITEARAGIAKAKAALEALGARAEDQPEDTP